LFAFLFFSFGLWGFFIIFVLTLSYLYYDYKKTLH
jgi:hypothetical protein